jgi:hypothetical protein
MAGGRAAILLAASIGLAGCASGGGGGIPAPPPPLDLRGATVMLLPVPAPAPAQIDRELGFWLTDRGARTTWLLPDELREVVQRSPGWRVRLDALPPGIADEGGGDLRVRDPLFREILRLAAVTDADYALLPLQVGVADAAPDLAARGAALQLTAALAEVRTGRVLWFGTVRGEPAPEGESYSVASLAEALARALLR